MKAKANTVTVDHFNSLKQEVTSSIQNMSNTIRSSTESIENTLQLLAERVQALENTCKIQADSRKRRHGDTITVDHFDSLKQGGRVKKEIEGMFVDLVYIDSEPGESETTILKIKEEIEEIISFSDNEFEENFEVLDFVSEQLPETTPKEQ
ncbi:hypothetical protein L6452_41958 [Arctium lappa]|uniref:Uncharacterized protein n=1 Tax=Arctium lappa TaxID=4217 RepID=A0ACB8XI44_ARCLA|nr:hypothetical protein L6452_41958 [Arctium lappa]